MVERSLQRKIRRLFWLLISVSLVPGIALVVSPDRWLLLPPGVQWSAYLFSIILMFAAFSLRLSQVGNSSAGAGQESRIEGGSNSDPQLGTTFLSSLCDDCRRTADGYEGRRDRQPAYTEAGANLLQRSQDHSQVSKADQGYGRAQLNR
jgi:hypothetical protein